MSRMRGAVVALAFVVGACGLEGSGPTVETTKSYPATTGTLIEPAPEAGIEGGSDAGQGTVCATSADCDTGQVCCGMLRMVPPGIVRQTMACQAGPCPVYDLGPIQLCSSATDCFLAGDICGVNATLAMIGIDAMVCNAPAGDGGTEAGPEGGVEGGSSGDADSGGDVGASDAPTGG